MLNTQIAEGLQVIHLPERVDAAVLRTVLLALGEVPSRGALRCVLDFTGTAHIRFQDLRDFTRRVRERFDDSRPIALAGLNEYCEEIVRFALRADDWDLFQEVDRVVAAGPAWGNALPAEMVSSRGRELRVADGSLDFAAPSLN